LRNGSRPAVAVAFYLSAKIICLKSGSGFDYTWNVSATE